MAKLVYNLIILSCLCIVDAVRVVCYFQAEPTDEFEGTEKFSLNQTDPNLCTHMVYSHAILDTDKYNITINDKNDNGLENFQLLKKRNPNLKTMISLRESNGNSTNYEIIVNNKTGQVQYLAKNITEFLKNYKFDGLVFDFYNDWTDMKINLINELRKLMKTDVLFCAGSGQFRPLKIDKEKVTSLSKSLDFFNLHSFNFYHPKHQKTTADHHAPLYHRQSNKDNFYNVDSIIKYWIKEGISADKINLGIPLFGISWTLSANITNPLAPVKDIGPHENLAKKGCMAFNEICQAIKIKGWIKIIESYEKIGPYAISPNHPRTWVGYDDPAMAMVKSRYILANKLGALIVNINTDDYENKCGNGKNPMMNAIWNTLNNKTQNTECENNSVPWTNNTDLATFLNVTPSASEIHPAPCLNVTPSAPCSIVTHSAACSNESHSVPPNSGGKVCFSSALVFVVPIVVLLSLSLIVLFLVVPIFWGRRKSNSTTS